MTEPRVALVTGGARSIGAAVARRLHAQGRRVVLADLLTTEAEALADELDGRAYRCDVTDSDGVRDMVSAIETEVFANTDERSRVSMVLEICDEIDFHSKKVPCAKYDDCIDQHPRKCVETLCKATARVPLRLIDVDAANALYELIPDPNQNAVLSTLAAALQLEPERSARSSKTQSLSRRR